MFDRKGLIAIERNDEIDEDELTMLAIDLGVEDFVSEESGFEIITSLTDFNSVRDGLSDNGYEFAAAEITFIPQNYVSLTDELKLKNMNKMIDMLEDNDDVQEVYHNWEMPEEE